MSYIFSFAPLQSYMRSEHITQGELAERSGVHPCSMVRYLNGRRTPDLQTLVQICNNLRISISCFIHPSDITDIGILAMPKESFTDITIQNDCIEKYIQANGLTQKTVAKEVSQQMGKDVNESTLIRFKNGHIVRLEPFIGFLNTYELPLSTLFNDPQLPTGTQASEVILPRETLDQLKRQVSDLTKDNTRLRAKLRQYQSGTRIAESETRIIQTATADSIEPSREVKIRRGLNRIAEALKVIERALDDPIS